MNNDQILKLKMLIEISCRCILKTYKEWTFILFMNKFSTVTYVQKIIWYLKVIKSNKVNKKYILNCHSV